MKDKAEPTLQDVIEVMQGGFGRVEQHLTVIDERLDGVEDSVRSLTRRIGDVEVKVDEMQETLEAVAHAVDKDAVTILDHGKRIARLERTPV